MNDESILFTMDLIGIFLLVTALVIFGWLAIKSRNVRRFEFQISVFILVWILGEVVNVSQKIGLVKFYDLGAAGLQIHLMSMAFISAMLWLRLYFSKKGGKKIVEEVADYLE